MVLLKVLRMHQWTKNLFLFLPLFFAGAFLEWNALLSCILGFILFSLTASAVYIINDIRDVEEDRLHPEKKNRPFASGAWSIRSGQLLALLFIGGSFSAAYLLQPHFFWVLFAYFAINLAYSAGLKKVALLDITMIATGFVLRVVAGGVLAVVPISSWIIIMTFLLALFLGLAKRRDDLLILRDSGKKMRQSLDGYNLPFIQSAMVLMAGVVMVSYIMYTMSPEVIARMGTDKLYITGLFVLIGLLRYLQLTLVFEKSGNPSKILLKDRGIQISLLLWVLSFVVLLYADRNVLP